MSKAFYRKYRSKKLSEVVGQNHITEVLTRAIEQGRIAHAYLFTGPRGVGKTSIARILAHEINNLPYESENQHPDIIEIDAASNNGVDDIRELREKILSAPFSAPKRIYIIDEVHMLSKAAFNALLKTLEEPPEHAVFILATTDAHKLPATIISRTQQFVFRYISKEDVCSHLKFIAKNENIKISDDAVEIIAERGGGSFRDSISLLDQLSNVEKDSEITAEKVEKILGLTPKKQIRSLLSAYETQNISEILAILNEIRTSGMNLQAFCEQFTDEIKLILAEKPHFVRLIQPIIRAKNSPFLELELLSILVEEPKNFVVPNPIVAKNHAQNSPKTNQVSALKVEKTSVKIEEKIEFKKSVSKKEKSISKAENPPENNFETENSSEIGEPQQFEWSEFVREVKKISAPLGAVLAQSGFVCQGGTLGIYAGKKIKKTQLDKAQNRSIIGQALAKIGAGGWMIETFETQKPPEDETAAKVFDIMGGGEEVKIDEQF